MSDEDETQGAAFWAPRWRAGQIGFHEGAPNDLLARHVERVERDRPLRILVPLAGKAVDLRWLAARGHEVVGVELVAEAVHAFFAEWGRAPSTGEIGGAPAFACDGVTLVCADMLALGPEALGRFDLVYDRAALVALPPSTRARYVAVCDALAHAHAPTLLISLSYPQGTIAGPPWSIDEAMVRELFARRAVTPLESRELPTSARLGDAGVGVIEETAYLVAARGATPAR